MRYRIGDVYKCVGVTEEKDGTTLPRFVFLDRVPGVIDIAGFTRITQNSIEEVIKISGLDIKDWVAKKEYTKDQRPYLHMYLEMTPSSLSKDAISKEILADRLSIYFKYFDNDYHDLKKIIGVDPLVITILKVGTMEKYFAAGNSIRKINPTEFQIANLLKAQEQGYEDNF